MKRLRSIEETLRHEINAMFQTTKELNEINKRTSKVVEEYFQSPEFIKEQNKAIDEYEEIQDGIKQEEEAENRAMANKLKQEAERIKQQAAKNENKRLTNTN